MLCSKISSSTIKIVIYILMNAENFNTYLGIVLTCCSFSKCLSIVPRNSSFVLVLRSTCSKYSLASLTNVSVLVELDIVGAAVVFWS